MLKIRGLISVVEKVEGGLMRRRVLEITYLNTGSAVLPARSSLHQTFQRRSHAQVPVHRQMTVGDNMPAERSVAVNTWQARSDLDRQAAGGCVAAAAVCLLFLEQTAPGAAEAWHSQQG